MRNILYSLILKISPIISKLFGRYVKVEVTCINSSAALSDAESWKKSVTEKAERFVQDEISKKTFHEMIIVKECPAGALIPKEFLGKAVNIKEPRYLLQIVYVK
jgi:hypothetical protein